MLKTLKDIGKINKRGTKIIYEGDLKYEAIKWVKEDKEELILRYGCKSYKSTYGYSLLEDWIERFNITEEDLK